MTAQTQPAAMPPKLQQLLASMPDVDKVKLMQIAHAYKMDLDDPGFLPLLLTQQGIEALDKARAGLESEASATLERVAEQIIKTREAQAALLKDYMGDLSAIVRAEAAKAQAAMQAALAAWAERSLTDALDAAIKARSRSATEAAATAATQAAEAFAVVARRATTDTTTAASRAAEAAKAAQEAAGRIGWALMLSTFFFGATTGAAGLALIIR